MIIKRLLLSCHVMSEILNIGVFIDFLIHMIEVNLKYTQQQINLLNLFFFEKEQHIYLAFF